MNKVDRKKSECGEHSSLDVHDNEIFGMFMILRLQRVKIS